MRGQFQHVFAFLMLMLIAVVVLLLGYKFIHLILQDQCQVEEVNFKNTLEKDLHDFSAFGTVKRSAISAPCKAKEVCFVDASKYGSERDGIYAGSPSFTYANSHIQNEVRSPSTPPSNVFLIDDTGGTTPLQLFSKKIATKDPNMPLCVNATSGNFRIGFNGKGRTVLLTDASG